MHQSALCREHAVLCLEKGNDVDLSRFITDIGDAICLTQFPQRFFLKQLLGKK